MKKIIFIAAGLILLLLLCMQAAAQPSPWLTGRRTNDLSPSQRVKGDLVVTNDLQVLGRLYLADGTEVTGSGGGGGISQAKLDATNTALVNLDYALQLSQSNNVAAGLAAATNFARAEANRLTNFVNGKSLSSFGAPATAIDMDGQKLTGLGTPTTGTDATTKSYVDNKTLDTFGIPVEDVNLNNNHLINVGNPILTKDAANKLYVDTLGTNDTNFARGTIGSALTNAIQVAGTASTNWANTKLAATNGVANTITNFGRYVSALQTLSFTGSGAAGTNVTIDFSLGNTFFLTATNNPFFIPTNMAPLQVVSIVGWQDGTGSRIASYSPTVLTNASSILSTAANSKDVITLIAGPYGTNVMAIVQRGFQ